ncbi:MAG: hypothetical protein IH899_09695, partial [Planctomycetes bacterium]|nr:hypothetical protein [Planctomycetota bacterium]
PDIPGMFLGLSGLVISILTTFLGIVAISDIRYSEGRLTGLGLAFFDAVFFPTLILNALMIGGPVVGLGMSKYIAWALLVTVLIAVLVDVIVLRLLWRKVTATEGNLLKTGEPTPVVHETPKPKKRKPSGWFVLVLVLVSLVVFLLIIGSLVFNISSSGVQQPATRVPPQDAMAQRRNWVLGPDGPALTDRFARSRKLQPSQHQQVNKILQDIYREYLVLLEKHTQRSVNADGHHVTTVTPFPKDITKLEEKLWGRLDPLLNREQQNLFRLNLPLHPKRVRRGSYSGGSIHDRGIFGFGDERFQIEIWRVGEWFHWKVLDIAVWPQWYPSYGPRKEPELPEAFRRWWKEPTEDGNQNDAPD